MRPRNFTRITSNAKTQRQNDASNRQVQRLQVSDYLAGVERERRYSAVRRRTFWGSLRPRVMARPRKNMRRRKASHRQISFSTSTFLFFRSPLPNSLAQTSQSLLILHSIAKRAPHSRRLEFDWNDEQRANQIHSPRILPAPQTAMRPTHEIQRPFARRLANAEVNASLMSSLCLLRQVHPRLSTYAWDEPWPDVDDRLFVAATHGTAIAQHDGVPLFKKLRECCSDTKVCGSCRTVLLRRTPRRNTPPPWEESN